MLKTFDGFFIILTMYIIFSILKTIISDIKLCESLCVEDYKIPREAETENKEECEKYGNIRLAFKTHKF
jgi:hypothetical protein